MAVDSFSRVFMGDFSRFGEDFVILVVLFITLMASCYFTFNALTGSTVRNRFRGLILGGRSESGANNDPSAHSQEGEGNQEAPPPGENQDAGTSPADFRAAGDGWEGEEDIDYVIDEDLLNQVPGAYSDEDSDDDRILLRRILVAAEDVAPVQQDESVQAPPATNNQQMITYNSTDDLGDTETEVSMTDDTDAETHAFHARGHDKGGIE